MGGIVGELLRLDRLFDKAGEAIKNRFGGKAGERDVGAGFANCTILFCAGAMAIVGSVQDGLLGDPTMLIAKGMLDGIMSVLFATVYGLGAVSYTHLDVYKRQPLHRGGPDRKTGRWVEGRPPDGNGAVFPLPGGRRQIQREMCIRDRLEPWYDLRLELPPTAVGRAMADIQRMGGVVSPPENQGEEAVLTGRAPVSALGDYAAQVTAYTKGQGRLSLALGGYAPCHDQQQVVEQMGYDPQRDLENSPDSVFCAHGAGLSLIHI